MTESSILYTETSDNRFNKSTVITYGLLVAALCLSANVFIDGLSLMVAWWELEEYSHGYMIPMVAAFLAWQKWPQITQLEQVWLVNESTREVKAQSDKAWLGSYWALAALALSLCVFLLGELAALYTIIQYGFLLSVYALVLATWGPRGLLILWAPLAYLLFMIPLPNFVYFNLSQQLQLISSELGVIILRWFNVTVFLSGNVIDLGTYKLQVVEACSGLRYLFPLTSFSFLVAYLYQGPFWIKAISFLSALPITVMMNSFRIAVIGVTVDLWGIEMAEGFLHSFEGWFIFIACLFLLFMEIWVLNYVHTKKWALADCFDFDRVSVATLEQTGAGARMSPETRRDGDAHPVSQSNVKTLQSLLLNQRPLVFCLLLLLAVTPYLTSLDSREEVRKERLPFSTFPLFHNNWLGRQGHIEENVLSTLKLTDHLIVDYRNKDYTMPVNLYVAFYDSQRKGASVHSPSACLPGGGWVMESLDTISISQSSLSDTGVYEQMSPANSDDYSSQPMNLNRAVIQKGRSRQLVYYWFQQRGRIITNEYLVKWYIFQDSLLKNRTDGALVRLVVPVPEGMSVEDADQQLLQFVKDFKPKLRSYIPE